jgi:hypothetical protein
VEIEFDSIPSKFTSNNNINNTGYNYASFANLNNVEEDKWKEIMFKIKLTEPEYKLLLKEKSKIAVNLNIK